MPDPTSLQPDATDGKIRGLLIWLASHREISELDMEGLRDQLEVLRETPLPPLQTLKLLEMLFACLTSTLDAQISKLAEVVLPIRRQIRHQVKTLQDVLEGFALAYEGVCGALPPDQFTADCAQPLQRAALCLNRHLLVSHMVAAPPGLGIWQRLHALYQGARENFARVGEPLPAQLTEPYADALLMACAQPTSFSSRELNFVAQYARRRAPLLEISHRVPADGQGVFWIDPSRDIPAFALSRRTPPPEFMVLYFSCDPMARQAEQDLAALLDGQMPETLQLPGFAGTPAGKGALRRLANCWGKPAKRRFPRRRQSHRATLCIGLGSLWRLLQTPEAMGDDDFSQWMITNESPDGYALMHLTGKTGRVHVGDIVAIRPDTDKEDTHRWQISLVRWALSENPEHLEIGLQVLAPDATPARLAIPGDPLNQAATSALLLPELPPLRNSPVLIVPAGAISDPQRKLLLLIEKNNLEIREVRASAINEQTGRIEAFNIEADASE